MLVGCGALYSPCELAFPDDRKAEVSREVYQCEVSAWGANDWKLENKGVHLRFRFHQPGWASGDQSP